MTSLSSPGATPISPAVHSLSWGCKVHLVIPLLLRPPSVLRMKSKIYIMAHKITQKDQWKVGPRKFFEMNLKFFPPFLTGSWHISSPLIFFAKAKAYSNVESMHLIIPLPGSLHRCWFSSWSDLSSNVSSPQRASLPYSLHPFTLYLGRSFILKAPEKLVLLGKMVPKYVHLNVILNTDIFLKP